MRLVPRLRSVLPLVPAGCLLALAAECYASPVSGQPAPPGSNVSYVSKNVFSLPVLLDQNAISNLRDIELYVRRGPGEAWKLAQTIKPTERAFVFKAADDGEYQFAVVGVDRQGRKSVPNLATKTPDSVIAVDTQVPQIDIVFAGDTPDGMQINCNIVDANANPFATEFYYQTRDSQWHRLLPLPNQPERYCIPQAAALTGMVKAASKDRAGNQGTREMNITIARQNAGVPPNTKMPYADRTAALPTPLPPTGEPRMPLPEPSPLQFPQAANDPLPLPMPPEPLPVMPQLTNNTPAPVIPPPLDIRSAQKPEAPLPPLANMPLPMNPNVNMASSTPKADHDSLRVPTPPRPDLRLPSNDAVGQAPVAPDMRQYINRPRVYLAYEVERSSTDAANKIQIWLTSDNGQTWTNAGDDADGRSPAEIRLPGEGVTGVRLMAGNQQPQGASNDNLVSWIELDVTKPIIEMSVRRDTGALIVQWNVRDKNLSGDPVDLYYADDPKGPWTAIAAALTATGEYRWDVPQHLAGKALHLRMLASDAAGNTAHADETCQGVDPLMQVIQTPPSQPQNPRVRFLGVSSSPQP